MMLTDISASSGIIIDLEYFCKSGAPFFKKDAPFLNVALYIN